MKKTIVGPNLDIGRVMAQYNCTQEQAQMIALSGLFHNLGSRFSSMVQGEVFIPTTIEVEVKVKGLDVEARLRMEDGK